MIPTVFAQAPAQSGGFDPMTLILIVAFAFLIFMMFRGRKKAQKQQQELRSQLAPGSEVMTNFGLFGTVVSIDSAENKVVLEISPGTTATVHSQAVAKVVPAAAPVEEPTVQDQSAYDGTVQDAAAHGATAQDASAYGSASAQDAGETPEETLRRLDKENKNPNA